MRTATLFAAVVAIAGCDVSDELDFDYTAVIPGKIDTAKRNWVHITAVQQSMGLPGLGTGPQISNTAVGECTGVLISPTIVATALHCLQKASVGLGVGLSFSNVFYQILVIDPNGAFPHPTQRGVRLSMYGATALHPARPQDLMTAEELKHPNFGGKQDFALLRIEGAQKPSPPSYAPLLFNPPLAAPTGANGEYQPIKYTVVGSMMNGRQQLVPVVKQGIEFHTAVIYGIPELRDTSGFMWTTTQIYTPGDSGGYVYNASGHIAGINSSILELETRDEQGKLVKRDVWHRAHKLSELSCRWVNYHLKQVEGENHRYPGCVRAQ